MNKLQRLLTTLCLCVLTATTVRGQETSNHFDITPRPQKMEATGQKPFTLTAKTVIAHDAATSRQAELLKEALDTPTGYDLPLREGRRGQIVLRVDTTQVTAAEGYHLTTDSKSIEIVGHDAAGVFYGVQTLLQLFPTAIYSEKTCRHTAWTVPTVAIEDAPAHPWRGMMLDVARYYFDKDYVKRFIDMMAAYKLNRLQFHLVDDSGWRMEIKKYPRLTEVGAWAGKDADRIGGYYTQDELKEIIAYAADRGIEVVPEIEFPAHLLSAIVAYPWLSCRGEQHEVPRKNFISHELLCVGKPEALTFLKDVLEETMDLFPSRHINIGGDEAVYTRWGECQRCQAVMKREGLTKASELQGWLTNKVAEWLAERGRTAMGWEEVVMRGRVARPVTAVIWHNPEDTATVARDGHTSVLAPVGSHYFDFPESNSPGEPQHATWSGIVPMERTYTMPLGDYCKGGSVLGVQGCIWTDQFICGEKLQEINALNENRSETYIEYFIFPRMLALAEAGWTPQALRHYGDFKQRLKSQLPRLDIRGWNYRVPEPEVVTVEQTADGFVYTLATPVEGADIRYTTDGTWPTVHAPRYTTPVKVKNKKDLRAITVVTPRHHSLPLMPEEAKE